MYDNGEVVLQDYKQAVYWYKKAAEQGQEKSPYNLGVAYAKGQGLEQDYAKAHMWFNISAYSGDPNAQKARGIVSKKMTSEQLAEAQRMIKEWFEKFKNRKKKKKKE